MLNSIDYFESMYPNADVSFVFPLAPYVAQFILTLVITHLSNVMSYNMRIVLPLLIVMATVMLAPFQALYFQGTLGGVVMIMGLLLVIGFLDNIAYASVAGLTSQIDGKYSAYYLIGVGSFGLIMNGVKAIINLSFPNAEKGDIVPIIVYFGCTIILIGLGLLLHVRFIKSDFYAKAVQMIENNGDAEEGSESLIKKQKAKRDFNTVWTVFKRNWLHVVLLITACIQLNMVHPGVMLKKPIPGMSDSNKTVSMIATFSATFIVGKFIGQYRKYYNKYTIVVVVLFRFLLEGFFFIQAITVSIPVFNTAWFGYVNIGLYGLTMGLVMVSLFILAPEEVSKDKKEISGFLAVIACNVGSLAGGFLALPFAHLHIID